MGTGSLPQVAVFGAGAFGGWTALELVRRGARVTLLDAWGPGNVRASSGGETRIIRAIYGTRAIYTRMAARALELWRAHDARFGRRFYRRTGVLWMMRDQETFRVTSTDALRSAGVALEELSIASARQRFPQIAFDDVSAVLLERDGGYLLARRACEHVCECVVAEGGEYRQAAAASPVRVDSSALRKIRLLDGQAVEADVFVFACGPWLGELFPDVVGSFMTPTRQEVYYFGTPPGDTRFGEERLPAWIDVAERVRYGIPGNVNRGFKIADDTPGPAFDPTHGERQTASESATSARSFIARRFPALARAPLVDAEVCQYESTPDAHFIVDRHPVAENVWIAGGGSGHGYKMGPAIGELVASLVLGSETPPPAFSLARFASAPAGGWQPKWS